MGIGAAPTPLAGPNRSAINTLSIRCVHDAEARPALRASRHQDCPFCLSNDVPHLIYPYIPFAAGIGNTAGQQCEDESCQRYYAECATSEKSEMRYHKNPPDTT